MTTAPCVTRIAGMPLVAPCDQCGHAIAAHRLTDRVCAICTAADHVTLANSQVLASLATVRFELAELGGRLSSADQHLDALSILVEALTAYVGDEDATDATDTLTGRVLRLEHPEEVTP